MSPPKVKASPSPSTGPQKTTIITKSKRRSAGRIAIPVGKRVYDSRTDFSPYRALPVGYSKDENRFYKKKSEKDKFKTYDVYKFNVYEYDPNLTEFWEDEDYFDAKETIISGNAVASFELSFDVQMWSGGRLNPHILRDNERLVAIKRKWFSGLSNKEAEVEVKKSARLQKNWPKGKTKAGEDKYRGKFGNYLVNLKPGAKTKKGPGIYDFLRYGPKEKRKNDQYAYLGIWRGGIAVHLYGPPGSEGCATCPRRYKYASWKNVTWEIKKGKKKGQKKTKKQLKQHLELFERDILVWMNITQEFPARLVLPGLKNNYPSYDSEDPIPKDAIPFEDAPVGDGVSSGPTWAPNLRAL